MISEKFDIQDFLVKTKDHSFDDFITLSNAEATEAERLYLKNHKDVADETQQIRRYVKSIKALINYARYEIVSKSDVSVVDVTVLEQIKARSHSTIA